MFQVYPTATRALGLGTCSGMASVGALITPFIAQVGVAPNTEGVGLTKAGPLRGPGCVCTAWSPVSNPPCGSSPTVCKRESGGSRESWDLSNITQPGGRGAGSQTRVFLMMWPKTVWIRINRPPRLRGKLMPSPQFLIRMIQCPCRLFQVFVP